MILDFRRILSIILILVMLSVNAAALAEAKSTLILPSDLEVIGAESFFGNASIDKVIVPHGAKVIGAKAFGSSSLKEIELPSTLENIADDAFTGCGAFTARVPENCYAYDWCVDHNIEIIIQAQSEQLSIKSVSCSATGESELHRNMIWVVAAQGGSGKLNYKYTLKNNSSLVASSEYTPNNYYCYKPEKSGTYVLSVTCQDGQGKQETSTASPVIVPSITMTMSSILGPQYGIVGDELTWSVAAENGRAPIKYAFTLSVNGAAVISGEPSETNSFTYTADRVGAYDIEVACFDSEGAMQVKSADTANIVSAAEGAPSAPALIFDAAETAFSRDEASAPLWNAEDIELRWEENAFARAYWVTLDKKVNGSWEQVLASAEITEPNYLLKKSIFGEPAEREDYRLGISASNLRAGNPAYSYFDVQFQQPDARILVEGNERFFWNQRSNAANTHNFKVFSALDWSAVSDSDWLTVDKTDTGISVRMPRNGNTFTARDGIITLTNGTCAATLSVHQGTEKSAPEITNIQLSQDAANPTVLPAGPFCAETYAGQIMYRFYEKQADSSWKLLSEVAGKDEKVIFDKQMTGFSFKADTDYRIRMYTISDSSTYKLYEFEQDMPFRDYYIRMANDGYYLAIDGQTSIYRETLNNFKVTVNSSNPVKWSSDADWLACGEDAYAAATNNVSVKCAPNDTNAARTGHITFDNGSKTVTLTVVQGVTTPCLLSPANLSTDANAPTVIDCAVSPYVKHGIISLTYRAKDFSVDYFESGEFAAGDDFVHNSGIIVEDYLLTPNSMKADTTYRVTTSSPDTSNAYYFILRNIPGELNVIYLNSSYIKENMSFAKSGGSDTVRIIASQDWTASSDSDWLSVSAASGTANKSKTLTVTAKANSSGAQRTGTVSFMLKGAVYAQVVAVQTNKDEVCEIYDIFDEESGRNARDAYASVSAKKSTLYAYVYSSADYSVTSDSDWLLLRTPSSSKTYSSLEDLSSGDRFGFVVSENASASDFRTATVTVACANAVSAFRVTQEPGVAAPVIVSPGFSTDYKNPTLCEYGDVSVQWNAAEGAEYYRIENGFYENGEHYEYDIIVKDTGAAAYSAVLPKEYVSFTDKYNELSVTAVNKWDNGAETKVFFKASTGDKAIIDGSVEPLWDDAYDIGNGKVFTVQSTANWTAASEASWITADKTGGISGETLALTVARNYGAARSGRVAVDVNGSKTWITVCQYAALPASPELSPKSLSDDPMNPTLLDANTASISVAWNPKPQAEPYSVVVMRKNDGLSSYKHIADSEDLPEGTSSYTFSNLALEKGGYYAVKILWSIPKSYRSTGEYSGSHLYYFTLGDEAAYLNVKDAEFEADWDWDYHYFDIDSSGAWTAKSNEDWLMVSKNPIRESDAGEFFDPDDERLYVGSANQSLCVSMLPNATGASRSGTVTLSCCGKTKTLTITQVKQYSLAELTSPVLSESLSDAQALNMGSLKLRWAGASGGTGKYGIYLWESAARYKGYKLIYEKEGITSQRCTLSESLFTEGRYYELCVGTEIENGEYYVKRYYFSVNMKAKLTAALTITSVNAAVGKHIGVSVDASGGTGDYSYAYQLMSGNTIVQKSAYEKMSYYSFAAEEAGAYYIQVNVKDSSGEVYVADSDEIRYDDKIVLSQSEWAVSADGGEVAVGLNASSAVSVKSNAEWLTAAISGAAALVKADKNEGTAARSGEITFTAGSAESKLCVYQDALRPAVALGISPVSWNVPSVGGSLRLQITASGDWSIVSKPQWIETELTSGTGSAAVTLYAQSNGGTSENGKLVIDNSGERFTLTICRAGNDSLSRITNVSASHSTARTGEAVTFTVSAQNADKVVMTIDGKSYDGCEAKVYSGVAIIQRAFSAGGNREIRFVPWRNNAIGQASEPLVLPVVSSGNLAAPQIKAPNDIHVNDACVVDWNDVTNSESYTVYAYLNGAEIGAYSVGKTSEWEVPKEIASKAGVYVILVTAQGIGWSQSEAAVTLKVLSGASSQDLITLSFTDQNGKRLYGDSWLPNDELSQDSMTIHWNYGQLPENGYIRLTITEASTKRVVIDVNAGSAKSLGVPTNCYRNDFAKQGWQNDDYYHNYMITLAVFDQSPRALTSVTDSFRIYRNKTEYDLYNDIGTSALDKCFLKRGTDGVDRTLIIKSVDLACNYVYKDGSPEKLLESDGYDFHIIDTGGYTKVAIHGGFVNKLYYVIGHKRIVEGFVNGEPQFRHLFAVAVRGSSDADDWMTDFTVGDNSSGPHIGFRNCSSAIYNEITEFINRHIPKAERTECKFWITGHSMGGAIANLLAVQLLKYLAKEDNMYCYTFASPNTINGNKNSTYAIKNFVSNEDLVTIVPLKGWGFKRHGHDYTVYGDNYTVFSQQRTGKELLENLDAALLKIIPTQAGYNEIYSCGGDKSICLRLAHMLEQEKFDIGTIAYILSDNIDIISKVARDSVVKELKKELTKAFVTIWIQKAKGILEAAENAPLAIMIGGFAAGPGIAPHLSVNYLRRIHNYQYSLQPNN